MFVKTHDHVLAANDHRHAARTRDSDHFIQSVAVFADIKLNVLDSLSRKELLRLATMVSSREAVNLDLLHSRLLRSSFCPYSTPLIPQSTVSFHSRGSEEKRNSFEKRVSSVEIRPSRSSSLHSTLNREYVP